MTLRPVVPLTSLQMRRADVKPIDTAKPEVRWVAPTVLRIDEKYQRDLSQRSLSLIRRIIAQWSWHKYKCPIVAEVAGGFDVIDGQHTAIAAATRGIELIPVLVVGAQSVKERAEAFVSHNRDRLGVTVNQLFVSGIAAGNPAMVAINDACDAHGVRILRGPVPSYQVDDIFAVGALQVIHKLRGDVGLRMVLRAVAGAGLRPIGAAHLRAASLLLFSEEYREAVTVETLHEAIKANRGALKQAGELAVAHDLARWKALAIVYFRSLRKGKRAA